MPRLKKRVPRLCRDKASDRALVYVDGRKVWLGRWGGKRQPSKKTRTAYDRFVAEWLANGRRLPAGPEPESAPTISLNEVMLEYWRHVQRYYRKPDGTPTSEQDNIRQALRPLKQLFGHRFAAEFTPIELQTVRQRMIDDNWSRGHVNKSIDRIKRMFRWAVSRNLVHVSIHQALATVEGLRKGRSEAREAEPVRPVPDKFVDAIRDHVAPHVWAMVELQRLTAMRPGEVTIMRGGDLETSGKVWIYRPPTHKTAHHGCQRVIAIGPKAQAVLKPWLQTDLTAYIFSPERAVEARLATRRASRKTPRWPSHLKHQATKRARRKRRKVGEHYTSNSYRIAVQRGCDAAFPPPAPLAQRELETARAWAARLSAKQREELAAWRSAHRWHPHQLRHNAATRIRREYGLEVARAVLGHRSAAVTEVYAEMDNRLALDVMAKLG